MPFFIPMQKAAGYMMLTEMSTWISLWARAQWLWDIHTQKYLKQLLPIRPKARCLLVSISRKLNLRKSSTKSFLQQSWCVSVLMVQKRFKLHCVWPGQRQAKRNFCVLKAIIMVGWTMLHGGCQLLLLMHWVIVNILKYFHGVRVWRRTHQTSSSSFHGMIWHWSKKQWLNITKRLPQSSLNLSCVTMAASFQRTDSCKASGRFAVNMEQHLFWMR